MPQLPEAHDTLHATASAIAPSAGVGEAPVTVLTDEPSGGLDCPQPVNFTIRRMLRSAIGTVAIQIVSTGLGFLTAVLLARLLGQDGYGRYTFTVTWAALLTIPALAGMDQFLVRGISRYDVEQRWALMKGLLKRANQIALLASFALVGTACAVAMLWLPTPLVGPFCLAMLLIPIGAVTRLRQAAMQAFGRVALGQMPEYLIWPSLTIVGIVGLAVIARPALTATSALAANVCGMAVASTVGAVLLIRTLPPLLRSARPEYSTRKWTRSSVRIMLVNSLWMTNRYIGLLILGTLDSTSATAVYGVVERAAALIVMIHFAINMPLAPAIARLYAQNDRPGLERTTEHMARVSTIASLPVCMAFAVFPGLYLGIFGPGFQAGATATTILAFAQLVNAATGPAGNLLIMTRHERSAMRATLVGLAVNVVLAVALVPLLGITGSAIAFASSLITWNIGLVLMSRRLVGVNATALRRLAMVGVRTTD
jgi:O-antigen/teichoic acid export membrane protein